MMKSKVVLFSVAVVAVAVVIFFSSGVFEKKDAPAGDYQTKEFRSKLGFTLQYPEGWIIDDSRRDAPAEFIRESQGKAFVAIQVGLDPRLKDPTLYTQALQDAEDAFVLAKNYQMEFFEWKLRDAQTNNDSYMAAGSYVEKGEQWRFRGIAVFNPSGTAFFLRGNVRAETAKEYGPVIDKILFSFQPTTNTVEAARAKIASLPEVEEYKKMLEKSDKKMTIEVEDGGSEWNVHVFEIVKNDDGSSHTATFGWYSVNKKTGVVEKDI